MKKQVTFSENQTVHSLTHDDALQRGSGLDQAGKVAVTPSVGSLNVTNGWKSSQQQQTPIKIPRTMSAAPYLQHVALTPAQKEFLYTIAASHSPAHVRSLISQHYMNVLHRCVRTGKHLERDELVCSASPESKIEELQIKTQSDAPPTSKFKGRRDTSAGRSKKSLTANRRNRSSNLSPNFRKTKKRVTASPRRKSPTRARLKLLDNDDDDEEEEEEYTLDSLSDCMSSLSMTEWDDDIFLDI